MAEVRHVLARWDDEARVWWAVSDDIPGFVTEASTFEQLIARSDAVIEDLLVENKAAIGNVVIEYRAVRSSPIGPIEIDRRTEIRA